MMRFALLGDSPAATAVAEALARRPEFRLVRLAGRSQGAFAKFASLPGVRSCAHWEELLTDADVDAVIVAESHEDWQPAVRQLVQAGKAVLVPPELVQSAAFFYELALFDAESPGRLFPLLDRRGHPLVAELRQIAADHRLGAIRHVELERTIATTAGLMTLADLASAFLVDADLLRAVFGAYDQVSASRSGDAGTGYSLATVTLAGSAAPPAVWTAAGSTSESGWKLSLIGESGTAVLASCAGGKKLEGSPLRLDVNLSGQPPLVKEVTADSGAWLLEEFASSFHRDEPGRAAAPSLWNELACAIELVDAVERSVRRRRTIDVYFETPSERGLFKTQMTAVGCSLLMLTLVAVVLYLVFEASIEMPRFVRQILVVLIFAPLGVFLALQLLLFLARPGSRN